MTPIRILLAEDHAIVREGLRTLLELAADFEVVDEATNGREAVQKAIQLKPDVVVMDIAMPLLNGFEATRQILAIAPKTRILVLSAHSDDEYVAHMAAVGAQGYLIKQNSGQILVKAVREIAKGKAYFSHTISLRLVESARQNRLRGAPTTQKQKPLTRREAEVLQMVAEGAANKQVALDLGISIKTVEKHRQQLMDKLNIHDTAGLTRYAIATGVVESRSQSTIS